MKVNETKIKTRFEVKNEAQSEVAKLYLYGSIRQAYYWDDEEDVISSKRVKNALIEVGDKDIDVHINSGGGDVFESIAIMNTLKQHKGKVNVIIDSLAGSGASVIAMAGDTIKMFPSSMLMIHKAWTFGSGNSDELRKLADDLDKIDTSVKASYQDRFVGTDEELEELIKAESWLTAEECKAFGFCDVEVEEVKETEPQADVKESLFAKYKKTDTPSKPTTQNILNKFKIGGNK